MVQLNSTAELSFTDKEAIYLTINRKQHKIILDEIMYIESRREYVYLYSNDLELKCKMSISELELLLSKDLFVRIHRSFIVSKKYIKSISMSSIDLPNKTIPIGRSYKLNIQNIWKSI